MADKKKKKKKTKKKEEKNWKEIFSSTPFLGTVFGLLLILIGVLGVLIYQKELKKEAEWDSHITIPVIEAGANFEFGIDLSVFVKEKNPEYIFKIVNYRDDEVNEEEIPYQILIENNSDSIISLTKEESSDDLIKTQKSTLIEGEILPSNEKKEVYYHLNLKEFGKIKNSDLIHVQIIS